MARRALFSKYFKLVFITLALIFVLLIILAFIAGGMLSAIGIIPTD